MWDLAWGIAWSIGERSQESESRIEVPTFVFLLPGT
jgi:hypothetical protein